LKTVSILGCGWLGLPLGAVLARAGWLVKGSTTDQSKFPELHRARIEPFRLLLDPKLQCEDWKEFFDADVMVVNIPPGRRRDDVEDFHPRQIAEVRAAAEKSRLPFILFVSSTSVYPSSAGIATEENRHVPDTRSGRALRTAEAVLQASNHFQTTVLRFAGLVGGDRNPARFMAGKKDVAGGDAPVNLIHRDDCIAIIRQIIERDLRGEVLNGVCDEHPTRREFYTAAAEHMGLEVPTFSGESAPAKIVSNEKLKRLLGHSFIHPDPRAMFQE
jgi:nucleoside-diphosphate-sugar epimerase